MNLSVMRFSGNSRNITETSQVFMGHDPHTKTHSGVRIILGYPNQDTWEDTGQILRGNGGRESSDDRGVNHIHHTSINPHTAIIGFLTTFKRTQIIQTTCDGEWHENLDTQHEGLGGARHWQCTDTSHCQHSTTVRWHSLTQRAWPAIPSTHRRCPLGW